ncbi:protein-glutamate methylesterase/protein-glutamine glutaminase [Shewanella nanhaiensis]|uniref:Protein-glutamate methylesterase/protein-glutamine glutaminase n=1 Tax=Shewanella nanhaiensis TaxID=2864872 RepID=A0ABS7E674_9GAMM|nr:chemotaxis response regulator protein-glutamate methylesterase [Shewanella nanhaiensis]MBW8185182.1 chemotaxis response regulator protein-glutamate methylesterase [Shewanella nanhaiensis]
MSIKVLVVDDSSFFRRRVSEIVSKDPDLEVIGTAVNGAEAVKMAAELKPNVITMDIEMPVMDGISAVREIMANTPVPILMFSSLTHDGAKATLDALEAGALDFLPKRFEDIATNKDEAIRLLQQRIKTIGRRRVYKPITPSVTKSAPTPVSRPLTTSVAPRAVSGSAASPKPSIINRASGKKYRILLIGTSTGGPVALQKILTKFPQNYPHPILLIQHMPAAFTPAFASRLNALCKIEVKEAVSGDQLKAGHAYLAPGGMQMMLERAGTHGRLKIVAGSEDMNYKPSVDITFASVSKVLGKDTLAVILTGMGADGREGSRMLKTSGATIWAQDEASCIVYGMPQAVTAAGLSSQSIGLEQMADAILRESSNG